MKAFLNSALLLLLLFSNVILSQDKTTLKSINTDVWLNFTKAFEDLDVELFSSIHCSDMIRVSGNSKQIKDKTDYLEGYKQRWENTQIKQTIAFRFLERIYNDDKASERGIYKLTRNLNTPDEKSYYGKFHVILKAEAGVWKILVDYDSNENNTITEISYNNAYSMIDLEKY